MFDARAAKQIKCIAPMDQTAPEVHTIEIANQLGKTDFQVDKQFLSLEVDKELERKRKMEAEQDALFEEEAKDLLEKQKKPKQVQTSVAVEKLNQKATLSKDEQNMYKVATTLEASMQAVMEHFTELESGDTGKADVDQKKAEFDELLPNLKAEIKTFVDEWTKAIEGSDLTLEVLTKLKADRAKAYRAWVMNGAFRSKAHTCVKEAKAICIATQKNLSLTDKNDAGKKITADAKKSYDIYGTTLGADLLKKALAESLPAANISWTISDFKSDKPSAVYFPAERVATASDNLLNMEYYKDQKRWMMDSMKADKKAHKPQQAYATLPIMKTGACRAAVKIVQTIEAAVCPLDHLDPLSEVAGSERPWTQFDSSPEARNFLSAPPHIQGSLV